MAPGLEALLVAELNGLGVSGRLRPTRGGAEVFASREELWTVALRGRIPESLRARIGGFQATDFAGLERGLARLPWAAYVPRGAAVTVRATSTRSRLFHTGAVAERTEAAVRELVGGPHRGGAAPTPASEPPVDPAVVHVRLDRDRATVSVDASGELLHRRGYRGHVGRAPLRETLAAACLRAAAVPEATPLWDPFCGSGTLVIEAQHAATGALAGGRRAFAFEAWPTHDAEAFASLRERLQVRRQPSRRALGCDVDPRAIAAARANAEAAGVAPYCDLEIGDFAAAAARVPPGAAVVTNLPYGHRTRGGGDLTETFGRFGRLVAARIDLEPVVVLNGHPRFLEAAGGRWERLAAFGNGGLKVELLRLVR